MLLAQLKQEAVELSPAEQSELMAFLASIQIAEDDELRSELTRKIDDKNPESWVSLDDLVHHNQALPPLCQI
jgi:hypothetical protein